MAWTDPEALDEFGGVNSDVVFRFFDASGAGGAILTANTVTTESQNSPSLDASADGSGFAIAWRGK